MEGARGKATRTLVQSKKGARMGCSRAARAAQRAHEACQHLPRVRRARASLPRTPLLDAPGVPGHAAAPAMRERVRLPHQTGLENSLVGVVTRSGSVGLS